MKNFVLFFIILFFGIFGINFLNAQNNNELIFGFAFPQAEFGEGDFDNGMNGVGQATTGIHFGYKHYKPLKINNLKMTLSIEAIYNELSRDFKDELEDQFGLNDYGEEYNIEITFPRYLNIPLLVGLNYSYKIQNDLFLFGEGNIGANIFKTTNLNVSGKDYYGYVEGITSFSPSVKFAYRYGVGLLYKEKYNITLSFYNLGVQKTKYKITIDEYGEKDSDSGFFKSMDLCIFSIGFGLKLQ